MLAPSCGRTKRKNLLAKMVPGLRLIVPELLGKPLTAVSNASSNRRFFGYG